MQPQEENDKRAPSGPVLFRGADGIDRPDPLSMQTWGYYLMWVLSAFGKALGEVVQGPREAK